MVAGEMMGSMAEIFQMLPTLLSLVNIIVYVVAVLFFGSIAAKGWRGYLSWPKKLALRLALGFVCVVTGVSVAPFLRLDGPFFKVMGIDLIAGMIVSTVVIYAAMKLMMLSVPYSLVLKEKIRVLQERLDRRKDRDAEAPKSKIRHPATVAGIVILVVFIAFALLNFRGVPDIRQSMLSGLGLSEEDFSRITEAMNQYASSPLANMSASCLVTVQEMQGKEGLWNNPPQYTNAALEAEIESKSGDSVAGMFKLESGGKTLIVAMLNNTKQCYATTTEFCTCT
jgi:hypothetical protein